ncbi:MAG: hypothetical protein ACM3IH_20260 [Sphingobacteriales bacterium]
MKTIDAIIAAGEFGEKVIGSFCETIDVPVPKFEEATRRDTDEILIWFRESGRAPPKTLSVLIGGGNHLTSAHNDRAAMVCP